MNNMTAGGGGPPDEVKKNPSQMQLHFRPLRADEIEVKAIERRGIMKASLLLYQDARSTMNILDETIGSKGWQKRYYEAGGVLFCDIGVYDNESKQWIWKSDTGSKSDIEGEKGLASDAFKRAAVSWGIGRELYSKPIITIDLTEKDYYNGKLCQVFKVKQITVTEGVITSLFIVDKWGNQRYPAPDASIQANKVVVLPTEITSSTPSGTHPNEVCLNSFYEKKKNEPGIDTYQLKRFFEWYTSPDKKNPSKRKIETFKNPIPERMWEDWLKKAREGAS